MDAILTMRANSVEDEPAELEMLELTSKQNEAETFWCFIIKQHSNILLEE